uniref:DUF659 domain-containing protein n=1 Tax=Ditylenchus dipsaci TaxID=166011 RepID=A0A915EAY5_9BILA
MGCFLAMDDVELLERGIVNKSGGRMSKQINAIDFVPDVNGRMKKFDANCLPKIPKPAARDPNSNQVVNPYCDKSEVMSTMWIVFSTEQLRRRIRSLSPAQRRIKLGEVALLGQFSARLALQMKVPCLNIRFFNVKRNKPLSCVVLTYLTKVHCPKPFLLNSIDATKNRTQVIGEYIAKLLAEEINAVGKSKVVAIVTDHAANMRSAWRLLAKDYRGFCSRMQGSHAKFGDEGYLRKDGDRWLAG